jgi:hypothetical protein
MAKWNIHINKRDRKAKDGWVTISKYGVEVEGTTLSMADAPYVNWWASKKYKQPSSNILSVPHRK